MVRFYKSLKDGVKDELYKVDRPTNNKVYIEIVSYID